MKEGYVSTTVESHNTYTNTRLRRAQTLESNHLPDLRTQLHELVQICVTQSAKPPEKSRAFLIKLFGRSILDEQIDDPIFSFWIKVNLSSLATPLSAYTDLFLLMISVTQSAKPPEKSRLFQN